MRKSRHFRNLCKRIARNKKTWLHIPGEEIGFLNPDSEAGKRFFKRPAGYIKTTINGREHYVADDIADYVDVKLFLSSFPK